MDNYSPDEIALLAEMTDDEQSVCIMLKSLFPNCRIFRQDGRIKYEVKP